MLKIFSSFALLFSCLFLQICSSVTSENIQSKIETDTLPQPTESPQKQDKKIQLPTTGKVEFKGVSFSYNPQIFGKVEVEEVADQPLENEDDKPDENFPKHLEFYFKQTDDAANRSIDKGRMAVVPLENYRRMFAVSSEMTKSFDENLKNLQNVLANKDFRKNGEIPFMPFYDAHQYFVAKVERISFQNGRSLCFLTQYEQESNLVNNEDIKYYCQGITNDNKNYFLAVFPVSVPFLPKDVYAKEFEGYKLPEASWNSNEVKQYENYISKITQKLEVFPADKYKPSLRYFEEIISSLKIEK